MKRSEMQMIILRALAELDTKYPDGYDYNTQSEFILDAIEKAGMQPPMLDDDKYYALRQVYIRTSYNMWDEDFEKDKKAVKTLGKILAARRMFEKHFKKGDK